MNAFPGFDLSGILGDPGTILFFVNGDQRELEKAIIDTSCDG